MSKIDELINYIETNLAMKAPSVPPQTAEVLKIVAFFISSMREKPIFVETGTGYGYSTAWLLKGILEAGREGVIHTIEIDEERALTTKKTFERFGFSQYVKFHIGDATKVLVSLDGHIDLLFLDNSKNKYYEHMMTVYDKLSPGSVILAHNVIDFSYSMKDFLEEIKNRERWRTTIFKNDPSGLSISIKL